MKKKLTEKSIQAKRASNKHQRYGKIQMIKSEAKLDQENMN